MEVGRRGGNIQAQASQTKKSLTKREVEVAVNGNSPQGDQNSCWCHISCSFHPMASLGIGHRWVRVPPNRKSPGFASGDVMSRPEASYPHGLKHAPCVCSAVDYNRYRVLLYNLYFYSIFFFSGRYMSFMRVTPCNVLQRTCTKK